MGRLEIEEMFEAMYQSMSIDLEADDNGITVKLSYKTTTMIHPLEITSANLSWDEIHDRRP